MERKRVWDYKGPCYLRAKYLRENQHCILWGIAETYIWLALLFFSAMQQLQFHQ